MRTRRVALAAFAVAVPLILATPAAAAPTQPTPGPLDITGGTTEFRLTAEAAAELEQHSIELQPVAPATSLSGSTPGVSVGVDAGTITPNPFDGSLTYGAGGFRLVDDSGHKIEFTDGRADLTKGTATALVDGDDRVEFAKYTIDPAKVSVASLSELSISGANIKLTATAAAAINDTFDAKVVDSNDNFFEHKSTLTTDANNAAESTDGLLSDLVDGLTDLDSLV